MRACLEELRGQEGTFINQRSSSAHSRGDKCQVEVCWGLCHRRGVPLAPLPSSGATHIPSLLLLQGKVFPTVKGTPQKKPALNCLLLLLLWGKKKE